MMVHRACEGVAWEGCYDGAQSLTLNGDLVAPESRVERGGSVHWPAGSARVGATHGHGTQ